MENAYSSLMLKYLIFYTKIQVNPLVPGVY